MALTYGFFQSVNSDRTYSALQLSSIFDGVISDGIFATYGNALKVEAVSGMNIKVRSGRAWFNHTWTYNDSDLSLLVGDAHATLKRKDAVVLKIDRSSAVRANSIYVKQGTPASSPVNPSMTHSADVDEYALAFIMVNAGATSISSSNITNNRGKSSCPFVTGLIDTIDITNLSAQWDSEFDSLLVAKELQFRTWFNALVDDLTEDQATHLWARINQASSIKYLTLDLDDWVQYATLAGEYFWVQTVSTDEHGLRMDYALTDKPILVDNYLPGRSTGSGLGNVGSKAQSKAYFKNFRYIASGLVDVVSTGPTTTGVRFVVYDCPTSDISVGLKGV